MSERIHLRDIKPYWAPDSLDELRGPREGVIELSHSVFWQQNRTFDLGVRSLVRLAYEALLAEGVVEDQTNAMNRDLLIDVWRELMMAPRVRELWEGRFPELKAARADG